MDVDPAGLADGSAMDAWKAMIRAQGGDPDAPLPVARESHVVAAPTSGVLRASTPWPSGWPPGAWAPVGPARRTRSRLAPESSGTRALGTSYVAGEPLFTLLTDEPDRFHRASGLPRRWLRHRRRAARRTSRGPRDRPDLLAQSESTTVCATQAGLSAPSISIV